MKKDIYRKAALERLATPDQLDKVMKITSPLSWIALLGITLIIVAVIIWSFVGSLPSTVTASGMIVSSSTATNTIMANGEGTVEYCINEGQIIEPGDVVAKITPNGNYGNEAIIECRSDQMCFVSTILANNGAAVTSGTELMRIRPVPRDNQKQVIVCYVPVSDIGKIDFEMTATITLTAADSNSFGHMIGRVINMDTYATSNQGIETVLGSDNSMAGLFVKEGGVCAVTLEPAYVGNPPSKNGYWWSNEKGYTIEFNDKMMCVAKITTKSEMPITKLFTKLKDFIQGDR